MQTLHKRSTLERQSGELLGHLDALFRRLVLKKPPHEAEIDCSREEMRALILLRASGRAIMTDFAAELGVPLSTATRTVDRLVRKRLVTRVRSEQDRRIVQVELSELGNQFQTALRARQRIMAQSWLEPLRASDRKTFLSLMAKIAEGTRGAKRERGESS